jgi:hypothetical protein
VTAQISDRVRFEGAEYVLLGPRSGLFVPQGHGIEVTAMSTACWRGFHLLYTLTDRLHLTHVHLQLKYAHEDVALFGKPPVRADSGRVEFRDLDEPIDFTGKLWLGIGAMLDKYGRRAFAVPYLFERVHEVRLAGGAVTAAHDRSDAMADMREQIKAGKISEGQLKRWLTAQLG